jgi:hypothetical protein
VLAIALLAIAPSLHAACSNVTTAGNWAYSYTGTILTPNGPLPAAAVGRFHQDASGNLTGSQTRSIAGNSTAEDISGTITVNTDCTATGNINILVNGQLQRTAVLVVVYDNNVKQGRGIFESLTLPDGTNVPVVITIDAAKLTP